MHVYVVSVYSLLNQLLYSHFGVHISNRDVQKF